jgi:hypothetical protein
VQIQVTDPLGRTISRDSNTIGDNAFYLEDAAADPGRLWTTVLIHRPGLSPIVDGVYSFQMTGVTDDTYSMDWFASERGSVANQDSIQDGYLAAGESQTVHTHLQQTLDPVTGEPILAAVASQVPIDIKPGSDQNTINLGSAGAVPVAILSSSTFDATTVDPETIFLEGASVKLVGKGERYLCHDEDVDGDELLDLLCQILTDEIQIEVGDSVAELTASTEDGTAVRGEDSVRIVPDEP